MEKTNGTIQKIAKVGKVLSNIIFVICIVAAALCVVSAVCWEIFGSTTLTVGNIHIGGLVIEGVTNGAGVITVCTVGFILLLGEIILSKAAQNYFRHELEAGTPFTMDGAKELIRLGVKTIVIPFASYLVVTIAWFVLKHCLHISDGELDQDITINLGLGIMFIIGGLLCRLGAQQNEEKKSEDNNAEN